MTRPTTCGAFWPRFVVALLAGTAVAQGVMLYAATHDPTFSVVPDYYRRGVGWDSTMAIERESLALGWRARAAVVPDGAGSAILSVRITDGAGAPVAGEGISAVRAELVHNLDGARHLVVELRDDGRGAWTAPLARPRTGMWEVRLDARGPAGRFATALRTDFTP